MIQYPSSDSTTRAYNVTGTGSNSLTFASAPANGVIIHVRHIGFAGASTANVTGVFGRSGNVSLIDSDPVVGIQSAGSGIGTVRILNFVGAGNTFKKTGNTIDIVSQVVEVQVHLPHQSRVFRLQLQLLVSEQQALMMLTYKELVILQEDFI